MTTHSDKSEWREGFVGIVRKPPEAPAEPAIARPRPGRKVPLGLKDLEEIADLHAAAQVLGRFELGLVGTGITVTSEVADWLRVEAHDRSFLHRPPASYRKAVETARVLLGKTIGRRRALEQLRERVTQDWDGPVADTADLEGLI